MNEAYACEYREVTAQPVQQLIGAMPAAALNHLDSPGK